MRLRTSLLAVAGISATGFSPHAFAQLEEIVVTARRVETNLQDTPISVAAFSSEDMELRGIDAGRDLGIMVPNVVISGGGVGERDAIMVVRGMPGVGVYVDGVWQGSSGVLQTNFVEMERVEVLRGPQGTLFGRNTNGGALQFVTRRPAEEFGARVNLEMGEFRRRYATLAVDLPLGDNLKTKWMAASLQKDGFLESTSAPRAYGEQDDVLFRGDVLWEPSDTFSLRFTANDEDKTSSDGRIVRFSQADGGYWNNRYLAYNILAGNPEYVDRPGFVARDFGLPIDRFTSQTHETNFSGGDLGKWETRANTMNPGLVTDNQYYTLTLNWDITDNLTLTSLTSTVEYDTKQLTDFDSSELVVTTDDRRNRTESITQELRLTGSHLDGRLTWLAGLYSLRQDLWSRFYRWGLWEFANPVPGPGAPTMNMERVNYVRQWGMLFDPPECFNTTADPADISCVNNFVPIVFIADDSLTKTEDEDFALFGEVEFGLTERLDLTLGVRFTQDDGRGIDYIPTSGFRTLEPEGEPAGNIWQGVVDVVEEDPDLGTISTPKIALSYEVDEDVMVYASYSEGFTSGGINFNQFLGTIVLDPEVVKSREIGLRSDWLDGRLRFNATYFDMDWDGLRVPILPPDPDNPGASLPFPVNTSEGLATASGAELETIWAPSERWQLNAALGFLDTEYIEVGDPSVSSLRPGRPFQYAPELSASVGAQYTLTLGNGGNVLFRGDYGWMDEYQRDAAIQRQRVDPLTGEDRPEPAYGLLNARVTYQPADASFRLSLFGTNLTDEWYVNGGFDGRAVWGYDFTTIGRPREVGIGLQFAFD